MGIPFIVYPPFSAYLTMLFSRPAGAQESVFFLLQRFLKTV